jgi:hypothetical protein
VVFSILRHAILTAGASIHSQPNKAGKIKSVRSAIRRMKLCVGCRLTQGKNGFLYARIAFLIYRKNHIIATEVPGRVIGTKNRLVGQANATLFLWGSFLLKRSVMKYLLALSFLFFLVVAEAQEGDYIFSEARPNRAMQYLSSSHEPLTFRIVLPSAEESQQGYISDFDSFLPSDVYVIHAPQLLNNHESMIGNSMIQRGRLGGLPVKATYRFDMNGRLIDTEISFNF